ncbi:medium-chain fatty acid-CoA ligase faa2 [Coemansia interrupta]|uniref:Medium-chain fatty acid-CoA ligase faa2 n=1 Tax=Coemansia interrupta TaxID=1126814 RepID=A0A9W8HE39_9FUNG|nr:medium-chain fatty acid-CoA ligase faa2 [Coemansia interrupta]
MSSSSIEVPNAPSIAAETKPRIAATSKDGKLTANMEGVNNMHDNFLRGMMLAGEDADFLGHRPIDKQGNPGPYKWYTFKQVKEIATSIGSGLTKLGVQPKSCIGIFSPNRLEWVLVEHASYIYNQITVPMYDTLGIDAIKHMAVETEMSLIVVSPEKLPIFTGIWPELPNVKTVVVFGDITDEAMAAVPDGARLITLDDTIALGNENELAPLPETPASPSDICTICYTSGTTGTPKGVVLSHMCFLSTTHAVSERIGHGFIPTLDNSDIHLSILPLAHCLERSVQALLTGHGVRIGFNQGDIRKLLDDIGELRPSILVGVPRIFNRINDQVWAQVNAKGGIASMLFNYAYGVKKDNLAHNTNQHWLWDRVVFKAVRQKFGGRIRLVISGSAPISGDVLDFLRVALSAVVLEGYGLTETTGPCGVTVPNDMKAGNVGCTLGTCMYKLVSVPDMDYTVEDKPYPRGEVFVKGNNVFTEYYKKPELTAETIDADGWVATGDIGMFDERGNLVIVDRKKNMFKLSQGEYVTPERIEIIYTDSALIDQAYIHGESLESVLVGVFVPNEEFLRRGLANDSNIGNLSAMTFAELCQNEHVVKFMLDVVNDWGRKNKLKGFEIPKRIYLESAQFSVENDILTPTLKIKRPSAKKQYADIIRKMYDELKSAKQ